MDSTAYSINSVLWIEIDVGKGISQLALRKGCKTERCGWSVLLPTESTKEEYVLEAKRVLPCNSLLFGTKA